MKQEDKELISKLVVSYGVYEVAKVLQDLAVLASMEYTSIGNDGAIVHSDAYLLTEACFKMAKSHPLRYLDVPQ